MAKKKTTKSALSEVAEALDNVAKKCEEALKVAKQEGGVSIGFRARLKQCIKATEIEKRRLPKSQGAKPKANAETQGAA